MSDFLPSVTVEEFTSIVKRQFLHGITRPIFGLGKGGIGKTESIVHLALKELQIGYKDIRLLLYSESDLKGIPYVNKDHSYTIWLQNDILPREDRDGAKGILVLDEVTSCSKSVRTAAYQLLNERCLGEYVLPKGWMVVCLGNGEEDGGQFNGMEGNFANRCSVYQVIAHLEAWKTWAYEKKIHPYVIAYLTWKPEHLHTFDPDKEEEFVFASPRSWQAVSDIFTIFGYDYQDTLTTAQVYANVGRVVGGDFLAFCKIKEHSSYAEDIVEGKPIAPIPTQELLLMTIQGVVFRMKELLEQWDEDFTAPFLEQEDKLEQLSFVLNWMMSLEKVEHQMMAVKDFMAIDRERITALFLRDDFMLLCPELQVFALEHQELLLHS